jgi:excisionase family DNA binding protein
MASTERYLTVNETAKYLRVGESTVYRALAEGRMPGAKVLGTWRVDRDELDAWIKEQRPLPRRRRDEPPPQRRKSDRQADPVLPAHGPLAAKIAELKARDREKTGETSGRTE